jgi:hypothetical protein
MQSQVDSRRTIIEYSVGHSVCPLPLVSDQSQNHGMILLVDQSGSSAARFQTGQHNCNLEVKIANAQAKQCDASFLEDADLDAAVTTDCHDPVAMTTLLI